MVEICLEKYRSKHNVNHFDIKSERENMYGFRVGDIVSITDGHHIGVDQILKLNYDEYVFLCL